jgi:fructose-bisphosphate aldolase class I
LQQTYSLRLCERAPLKAWLGKEENIPKAQEALSHRALMNKFAANGAWNLDLE